MKMLVVFIGLMVSVIVVHVEAGKPSGAGSNSKKHGSPHSSPGKHSRVFANFDKNGDGFLSLEELQHALQKLEMDMSLEDLRKEVGADGLNYDDFEKFVDKLMDGGDEGQKHSDLSEAFHQFADPVSGVITAKSLQKLLAQMKVKKTEEECQVMINQFDNDHNGVLSLDEFLTMMGHH